jgi:hypothetical protein
LGDLWEKHIKGSYIRFYVLPNINPSRPSAPSSHRMRENPFLGQYTLKSPEIMKWGEIVTESGKYGQRKVPWLFKGVPSSKPIPKEDHLIGHNVNHQGEVGKNA